jgi:hypothetical protein
MVQGTSSSNGVAAGLNNPVNLGIITMTIASPAVFTQTGHGFKTGDQFMMQTTGALPTGLTALTPYYVTTVLTSSTFRASATPGGTDIVTTGSQSGVHTLAGGSYCGIQIDGATGCFIDIACTERKQYDTVNAYQMNAIGISSVGSVTTQNNIIRISHAGSGALAANALGPPILPGSTIDGSNSLEINGTEWPTKRSDQTVAGTTLTDETDMQIYLTAGTKYRITGKIFFNCVAANGLKYGFTGPAVTSTRWERVDNATTQNAPAARVLDTVIPGSTSLTGTGTTGIISIDAVIVPSASGMLKFQFAEVANSTGAVVLAGSYLNAQGVY